MMRYISHTKLLFIALAICVPSFAQSHPGSIKPGGAEIPSYNITFEEGQPIAGVGAIPAITLPFECTSDGTAFINAVQSAGAGSGPPNLAPHWDPTLLISIERSGKLHSFPLNQVPDLYFITELGVFATESRVFLLLRAAKGNVPASLPDGSSVPREFHFYVAVFDRDGTYSHTTQLDDAFESHTVGMFPSGNFLAYGFDKTDHSPRLAMLKDDGTLLQYLEIPKGGAPDSVMRTRNNDGKGMALYISPVQMVGMGHSIYILQGSADFPILEVTEAGAIRQIHAKLPDKTQIGMLIASDVNLYARPNTTDQNSIYEIDAQTGAVLRRLRAGGEQSVLDIACVNDNKFLSFKQVNGTTVPLIGTAGK